MTHFSANKLVRFLLLGAGAYLAVRYALPVALPFLLAALLAFAAEPLVRALSGRLPRPAAAGIGITLALIILALGVLVLGALLLRQVQALIRIVPDLESATQQGLSSLEQGLLSLAEKAPENLQPILSHILTHLFSGSSIVLDEAASWLLGLASGLLSQVPDSIFGVGTWLLACYMISAKLPALRRSCKKLLPQNFLPSLQRLKKPVLGWLRAQGKLVLLCFLTLSAGFLLLRIPNALVWALVIALVDMLPVLGSGTVLIPWSIVCFLQNDSVRAIGLLGIYVIALVLRSALEPKLLGRQLGLDSLATLAAMYAGFRLWGILGLIAAPLLTVIALQFLPFSQPEQGNIPGKSDKI